MNRIIIFFLVLPFFTIANQDSLFNTDNIGVDSITELSEREELKLEKSNLSKKENIIALRLQHLDENTPMDLVYNDKVQVFIDSYLGINKTLISRMKGLTPYYFPMFERELDQFNLPIEFKYLAIVESALDPKARSASGASGLWQFMYLTGKQYGLEVTSYMDERQDPLKATKSACEYL